MSLTPPRVIVLACVAGCAAVFGGGAVAAFGTLAIVAASAGCALAAGHLVDGPPRTILPVAAGGLLGFLGLPATIAAHGQGFGMLAAAAFVAAGGSIIGYATASSARERRMPALPRAGTPA